VFEITGHCIQLRTVFHPDEGMYNSRNTSTLEASEDERKKPALAVKLPRLVNMSASVAEEHAASIFRMEGLDRILSSLAYCSIWKM
jgi:hypothetical protein